MRGQYEVSCTCPNTRGGLQAWVQRDHWAGLRSQPSSATTPLLLPGPQWAPATEWVGVPLPLTPRTLGKPASALWKGRDHCCWSHRSFSMALPAPGHPTHSQAKPSQAKVSSASSPSWAWSAPPTTSKGPFFLPSTWDISPRGDDPDEITCLRS